MKNLLSDPIVAKYRSLPNFLWYIICAVSVFFGNAYSYLMNAGVGISQVNEALTETGLPIAVNPVVFIVLTCVFSSLFTVLIFELINHLVSGVLLVRFRAKTSRDDLKFRLRVCYIYSNLITGLIGIAYFFTQVNNGVYTGSFTLYSAIQNDVEMFLTYVVSFSSMTFFAFLFFEDTRVRFIANKNHARCFLYFARIYFGIALIVSLIRGLLFIGDNLPVTEIISDWVDFGVCALWAGAATAYYFHLKKKQDDDKDSGDDNVVKIVIEDTHEKNIYDDFGF